MSHQTVIEATGFGLYRITIIDTETNAMVNRRKDVAPAHIDRITTELLSEV